ncbi:MAG: ATP/GTP-binding protein [Candidatus Bathyarchaeia archaeon]
MTNTVFLVGMAGSGKSSLTASYSEWLKNSDQDVLVANFDPGATAIPYNPDIDARKYVDVENLMLDYKLGPNGALIMASDLLADHLEEIREEVEDANPDILLVDTPGQIELFAFREGGRFMANELTGEKRAVIYLMDAPFVRFPLNFVSSIYLAAAISSRIMQPQVYALSKTDLVTDQDVDTILEWATEPEAFAESLRSVEEQNLSMISMNLATAVFESGLLSEPIPVSSKDNSGMVELNAAVTRILTGGEEQSS